MLVHHDYGQGSSILENITYSKRRHAGNKKNNKKILHSLVLMAINFLIMLSAYSCFLSSVVREQNN